MNYKDQNLNKDNNPIQTHPDDDQVLPQAIPLKKLRKRREKPVDKQLVTAMLADGYTKVHIAEVADCHEKTVYQIQNKVKDQELIISNYIQDRAKILAFKQLKTDNLVDKFKEKLEKHLEAGELKPSELGRNIFYLEDGAKKDYEMERLETGKSTQNITSLHVFMDQAHEKL